MPTRLAFILSCAGLWFVLAALPCSGAEPIRETIVGWDRNNGQVLLTSLNCVACHSAGEALPLTSGQAPILSEVGSRVTPQYFRAFLSDPQKVKPGTPMPDLLHHLKDKERDEAIDLLTHYLVSLGTPIQQKTSGASKAQIEHGQELYHSVGCVACHQPFAAPPKHKKDPALVDDDDPKVKKPESPSVPLGDLSTKTTVEQLTAFLVDPHKTRPSGRMPGMHLKPAEARMIAAYLLRDQYTEDQKAPGVGLDVAVYEGSHAKMPDFDKLKPRWEGESKGFDLDAVLKKQGKGLKSNFAVRFRGWIDIPEKGKYRFWTTSDDGSVLTIDGKVVVDNDGMHPPGEKEGSVELTKGSHTIELGFTQGGGGFELQVFWQTPTGKNKEPIPAGVLMHTSAAMIPRSMEELKVDSGKAERGQKLFASLGCATCHATRPDGVLDAQLKLKAPEMTKLQPGSADGCLGDKPTAGRPRFALSETQRKAMQSTLNDVKSKKHTVDSKQRLDHLMTSMNCYACHSRGDKGGPDKLRSDYFVYEVVVDLGDEGRFPPALNEVGAKLTTVGFEDALFSGKRYRSYMATRMPNFGKNVVGHLPEMFGAVDVGKIPEHKLTSEKKMPEDGRKMVVKTAFGCINCHAWGSLRLPGAEGLDLLQVPRRLQPGWFHAFMLDPQKLKPRTRMPAAWPDGKSFFADIQGGDAHKQIDAVWTYLAAGEKGGIPAGLAPLDDTVLVPIDEPIVFRTFLDGISAHAILVGFPQRLHLVFDANRVRTVATWSGAFISTKPAWEGRAGQYAKIPSDDVIRFPDSPPFARLEKPDSGWPTDAAKLKLGSSRTPEGWQFKGYRYDDKGIPTFLYIFDDVTAEETPRVDLTKDGAVLMRQFRLTSEKDVKNLHYRALVGKKIVENNGTFIVDDKLKVRYTGNLKPSIRESAGSQELLLPIEMRPTKDKKGMEAMFGVELSW